MTRAISVLSRPHILPAGFIEPCIPTAARIPPTGPGWLHEIKHDGYRLMARLEGRRVRLFSGAGMSGRPLSSHRWGPRSLSGAIRNDRR